MHIYKPKTSRPTNSEKYIICKGFLLDENASNLLSHKLSVLSTQIKKLNTKFCSFKLFKDEDIPHAFERCLKGVNESILKTQCDFLTKAVELCNDPTFLTNYENKLDDSIERRKETFKEWEEIYNLGAYV
jgi:hypothetical protein